jgi:flavin reductase (DIM6/NTAB) family NADH-FMN oxidoreductase RutF
MDYEPRLRNHGLPHDPFKALVVPRPIGWISTISPDGVVNLAPYSFFNAVADRPPMVMFAPSGPKDSQANAEATGEFVASLVTWDLREQMNATSAAGESVPGAIVIGEVVSIHIDESVIVDGCIDLSSRRAISRLGYMDYGVLDTVFSMQRPG